MPLVRPQIKHADVNDGDWLKFISAAGSPSEMGGRVENITRPGIDGVALRKLGQTSEPFRLTVTRDVGTPAEVVSMRQTYGQYRDKLVSLRLPFGDELQEWNNVAVLLVRSMRTQGLAGAAGAIGTNPAFLLTDEFELQLTDVPD